jgi:hypothetical protein
MTQRFVGTMARAFALGLALLSPCAGLAQVSHSLVARTLRERASIAVGADGVVHVVYMSPKYMLRHSWMESGRWRDEAVDTSSEAGRWNSVAVDAQGRVHVAYNADRSGLGGNGVLAYAVRDEAGWTVSDVGPGGNSTSIAVGSDGMPRILSVNELTGLEYATFDGAVWNVTVTGFPAHWFMGTSLTLDGDDHAFCTYGRNDQLSYATNASGAWSTTPLGVDGANASIALDAAGSPHVAAAFNTGDTTSSLEHFWYVGGQWQHENIVDLGEFAPWEAVPEDVSLVADATGRLVALASITVVRSYGHFASFPFFAYFNGVRWRPVLAGPALTGVEVSLAAGPDGAFHGTYSTWRDKKSVQSRYARLTLPDLEATWTDFQSAAVAGGVRVDGHVRVRNLGLAGSKPVRMTFYLSDDDVFDAQDQRVGRAKSVPGLRGREWNARVSFTIPGAASGKRLLAVIDDKDADRFDDLVRANNIAAATIQ